MADQTEKMDVEDDDEILPGYTSFQAFSQQAFGSLVKATQKANELPTPGDDHEFYLSFSDFKDFSKAHGKRLLGKMRQIIHHHHLPCHWSANHSYDRAEIDDLFDTIVEVNDTLLEHVDSMIDEATGLTKNNKPVLPPSIKQSKPIVSSWNKPMNERKKSDGNFKLLHAKNIQRPQLKFKDKIDNSNTPFIPIIKYKPHAKKPLQQAPKSSPEVNPEEMDVPSAIADFIHQQRIQQTTQKVINSTAHPYQFELDTFEPPDEQLEEQKKQILYQPLEKTPYTFIHTPEQLDQLVQTLSGEKEIAIDLEHHSYRSFQGFLCLMQISTRDEDFLVDTIELRSQLHVLNEVFVNPAILKVLHGADMDIGWLQRDLGLYIVNMFDTGQAARVLSYARYSLAFVLKKFCDIDADKQYQLADWRLRPLPEEMVKYAREDTHYLLFIYDQMKNELIKNGNAQKNLLKTVYSRSRDVCLKRYEKPLFTNESYLGLYHKHKKEFSPQQLHAFRLLYKWRDNIARQEDESTGYVLPNHMLFHIAETLPRDPEGVLACCNPVPTLIRQNLLEIHRFITEAKEMPSKVLLQEMAVIKEPTVTTPLILNDSLHSKQSTSWSADFEMEEMENMSNPPKSLLESIKPDGPPVELARASVHLLDSSSDEEKKELTGGQKKALKIKESFTNPFEMYNPAETVSQATQEELTQVQSRNANEINEQWRENSMTSPSPSAQSSQEKRKRESVEEEERVKEGNNNKDEVDTPVREKLKKKKKRKKVTEDTEETGTLDIPEHKFVPFDYSKAAQETFAGTEDSPQSKEVFNPYKQRKEKRNKIKSKVKQNSGRKSMTYTKNKSSNPQQQWPRR